MLQSIMERLAALDIRSSVTICNEEHRFFVAEQLWEISSLESRILEAVGRNIALAALLVKEFPWGIGGRNLTSLL